MDLNPLGTAIEPQNPVSQVPTMEPGVSTPPPAKSKKLWVIAVVIILVLAGLGWGAYAMYYSPTRVWQKFVSHPAMPNVASDDFSIAYTDNGKVDTSGGGAMMGMFSNLKFSFSGNAYVDIRDQQNPKMKMNLLYSFGSGDSSISSAANLIVLGQDIYFNLGDNPFVSAMLSYLSPGQKIDWIKLNAKDLQAAAGTSTSPAIDYAAQAQAYQQLFAQYAPKVILVDKFIGKDNLRGVTTYHYSNKIDKQQAKAFMSSFIDEIMIQVAAQQPDLKSEDISKSKTMANKIVSSIIDGIEFKDIETWVGMKDGQLYKIKYTVSAPSLASMVNAGVKESDASTGKSEEEITDAMLKDITYDAEISSQQEMYDFGKTQDVSAPANAFDLAKKIQEEKQQQQTYQQNPQYLQSSGSAPVKVK